MNGELHNNDENAPTMWMPTGSIWTQPKGQPHITSAQGENAMAYIEIDSGPYLVKPIGESFESDERPINIHTSNVIYLGKGESTLIGKDSEAQIAYTWKKRNGENGYLLKLPEAFSGEIHSEGTIFYGIVVNGEVAYKMPNTLKPIYLEQGSHFTSKSQAIHKISVLSESLIYIRTNDKFIVN